MSSGIVTVRSGSQKVDVAAGSSVASIRSTVEAMLNIDPNAKPYVGGAVVSDGYVPTPGTEIRFVVSQGQKGA